MYCRCHVHVLFPLFWMVFAVCIGSGKLGHSILKVMPLVSRQQKIVSLLCVFIQMYKKDMLSDERCASSAG